MKIIKTKFKDLIVIKKDTRHTYFKDYIVC